jgi:predicted dinucleotide-utilizing enzyme
VVITKGKEVYTNDLVVQYDPKSAISVADKKANEEVTRKLFDMTQELAYLVYEVDETIKAAENAKSKSPSAAKTVTPFIAELNKLKETLVVTTGDNYVGAGEPQLREDLSELYSKVASTFYKPSGAEMDNLSALTDRMQTAKATLKKTKEKHNAKLNEVLAKNKLEPIILKPFDEFLKSSQ